MSTRLAPIYTGDHDVVDMSNTGLAILTVVLGICVALALTNPTSQDYGAFLQTKLGLAVAQMDQSLSGQERALLREIYATQGRKLIELVLQKYTQRRNFGLFSLYESRVLEQKIVVVGMAAQFIPVEGVEEVMLKLGQLVPTLKR